MTNRTAAARYARALFDVALKEQADLSQIEAELITFVELFTAHPALSKVLLNPAVPAPRKRAAVEAVVERAGVSPVVGKLLVMLADRDRLVLLPDLLTSYRERMLDHQQVVRAEVISAEPLRPDQVQQIRETFANATGRTVTLSTRVDPGIIGGMVAKVGSTVYDASVTTQLRKMRQQLAERV